MPYYHCGKSIGKVLACPAIRHLCSQARCQRAVLSVLVGHLWTSVGGSDISHRSNLDRQKSNFRCELALWLMRLRACGDSTGERLDSVRPINRTPSGTGKSCTSNARAAAPN